MQLATNSVIYEFSYRRIMLASVIDEFCDGGIMLSTFECQPRRCSAINNRGRNAYREAICLVYVENHISCCIGNQMRTHYLRILLSTNSIIYEFCYQRILLTIRR